MTAVLTLPTAAATRELGQRLGRALLSVPGVPQVIALNGDLGAGKTTFVSGVLAGFGLAGPARSPTYTLIEPYEAGTRSLYHLDLYRLSGPEDLEALGLRDLHVKDSTLLIEWAERGAGALPPVDLTLAFGYAGGEVTTSGDAPRELKITPHGAIGERVLDLLKN
ncbi:MAG: tRNA (adenosine(37)-N6)-threonylcarbamoyltransferase complex ATPase subunit type 1 TsaE [Steroidobacteraceae bacterium]